MPKNQSYATFFRLLSARSRVAILRLLRDEGGLSVEAVADQLGLSLPTVSRHLQLMRVQNLVKFRQEGQHRYYVVNGEEIVAKLQDFLSHLGFDPQELRTAPDVLAKVGTASARSGKSGRVRAP